MAAEDHDVKISKGLAAFNAVGGVATRLLDVTVIAAVTRTLLKYIPPEEYQLLPIVLSLLTVFPLVASTLTAGFSRYVTEAVAKGDRRRVAQILSSLLPALILASLILSLAGAIVSYFLPAIISIPEDRVATARFIFQIAWYSAALQLPVSILTVGITVQQEFVKSNLIRTGAALGRSILLLLLIYAWGPQIEYVVITTAISQWIGLLGCVALSYRIFPLQRVEWGLFDAGICRELFQFGGWSSLGQLAGIIRNSADPLILNRLATPVDVSAMHLGGMVDRYIRQFAIAGTNPLLPALTAMHAKGQVGRLRRTYYRGARLGLLFVLFIAAPLMLFPWELMHLYLGSRYETYAQAPLVMLILLCTYFLQYPRFLLPKTGIAKGEVKLQMSLFATLQMVNLLITLVLVGYFQWGAVGSATATLASNLLFDPLILWPFGLRLVEGNWPDYLREVFVAGLKPFLATATVGVGLRWLVGVSDPTRLAFAVACSVITYAVVAIWSAHSQDKQDMLNLLNKAKSRLRSRTTSPSQPMSDSELRAEA